MAEKVIMILSVRADFAKDVQLLRIFCTDTVLET